MAKQVRNGHELVSVEMLQFRFLGLFRRHFASVSYTSVLLNPVLCFSAGDFRAPSRCQPRVQHALPRPFSEFVLGGVADPGAAAGHRVGRGAACLLLSFLWSCFSPSFLCPCSPHHDAVIPQRPSGPAP